MTEAAPFPLDLAARYERLRAVTMGAVPCDRHQIVAVLRRMQRR